MVTSPPPTPGHEWIVAARRSLVKLLESHSEVISEMVWRDLEADGIEPPAEPRLMGGVFHWAKTEGMILPTRRWVRTTRRIAHRRPMRVWRAATDRGVVVERR